MSAFSFYRMKKRMIIAPNYVEVDAPIIFLAGPIQGANRWQDKAAEIISRIAPEIFIASPRREGDIDRDFAEKDYNEQMDWETFHLRKAGKTGAILFWLAKESDHNCGRAYAQTTRFELGEWKSKHEEEGASLIVGIEDGFTGARYIRRRLAQDCPKIIICSTLEETCKEAVRLAKNK